MFKALVSFIDRRVALLLRIAGIFAILLGGLFLMISIEMFSHGQVFAFLGFISILVNAIGITSGILILVRVKNELGVSLMRNFCLIGLVFSLFYSIIANEISYSFLMFVIPWILIYVFLARDSVKTFILPKENTGDTLAPGHRYLRLHWILIIYAIGMFLIFVIIWFVNWETQAKFYREPNGGGISNFVSETDSPRLAVSVEGGFVYGVGPVSPDYEAEYYWPGESDVDGLLGEVKIKLINPSAKITIYTQETGMLRLNILNMCPSSSVLINSDEFFPLMDYSRAHWDNENNASTSLDQIISGRHLTRVRGVVFDMAIEIGGTEIIEIKHDTQLAEEGGFRFVVMSDLHSGYNIFMPEIPDIIDFKPAFGIINGDFTNLGYPSEYMMIAAATEMMPFPLYTSIGNHDAWNSGGTIYNKYYGPNNYSFVYKNSRFIIMDTSSGIIGETQFDWLIDELENNESENVFVISHMPPIDTVTGEFDTSNTLHPESLFTIHSKSESDYFLRLMKDYEVDVVFAGHTHVHGISVIDGTTYVTSGVLGGSVKPGNTIGYLEVVVTDSEIAIELIDILSVEEVAGKALENYVQALRVFLMPFMINNSIRIALTLFSIVMFSLLWIPIRRKLVFVIKNPITENTNEKSNQE